LRAKYVISQILSSLTTRVIGYLHG